MTREEAIEVYNGLINTKIKEAFEFFAPELRESEDDEIIRFLINWINDNGIGTLHYIDISWKEKILAWLEKQKELPFVKDAMLGYPGLYFYDGERMHFQGNPAIEEKQKEQKPVEIAPNQFDGITYEMQGYSTEKTAEWSEEDESCWNLIWDILDGSFTASKEGYKKAATWFLKNCPKGTKSLRPQPKRDGLDDYMKGYSKGYADAEKEYNERTSYHIDVPNNWPPKMPDLPTQTTTNDIQSNAIPHWKPSKDEERLINTSISFLKDFADKGYENAVECIDWLKSKLNGNTGK